MDIVEGYAVKGGDKEAVPPKEISALIPDFASLIATQADRTQ